VIPSNNMFHASAPLRRVRYGRYKNPDNFSSQ